jgi:5-methylcytosine-specific restriction enzyme subunit McrC
MLAYAFRGLDYQGIKNLDTEEFDSTADLCAAILAEGVAIQVKRGLGKEYVPNTESVSSLRGKIYISESMKTLSIMKRQLVCSYDEFSVNTYMNQIIKTSMLLLLRTDISKDRKRALSRLIVYFKDVDVIDPYAIDWNINYNKNNMTYKVLVSICYLIINGLLHTNTGGSKRLMDFIDEQYMHKLYERFVFEYYRREHPKIKVEAAHIPWQVDDGMRIMLPTMKSDITLTAGNRILIIDTKYYNRTTQLYYNKHILHSNNLYQIFAYVKNKDSEVSRSQNEVSGMLLYANTDEEINLDNTYLMSGNRISVKTLDLNCVFACIKDQLNSIVNNYFYNELP